MGSGRRRCRCAGTLTRCRSGPQYSRAMPSPKELGDAVVAIGLGLAVGLASGPGARNRSRGWSWQRDDAPRALAPSRLVEVVHAAQVGLRDGLERSFDRHAARCTTASTPCISASTASASARSQPTPWMPCLSSKTGRSLSTSSSHSGGQVRRQRAAGLPATRSKETCEGSWSGRVSHEAGVRQVVKTTPAAAQGSSVAQRVRAPARRGYAAAPPEHLNTRGNINHVQK